MLKNIRKRDGRIVDFDQTKITDAVFKALTAANQGDGKKAKRLSDRVVQKAALLFFHRPDWQRLKQSGFLIG